MKGELRVEVGCSKVTSASFRAFKMRPLVAATSNYYFSINVALPPTLGCGFTSVDVSCERMAQD